jgi:protein-arginine kinase activator protein McsA
VICPKCGHGWNYKGKSTLYVTCPNCYRKIRADPSGDVKQLTTTQSISLEEIEANRDRYVQEYFAEQPGHICLTCSRSWERFFVCKFCHAQFITDIPEARLCPSCGGSDLTDYLDEGDSPVLERLKKHDITKYGTVFNDANSLEYIDATIKETNEKLKKLERKRAKAIKLQSQVGKIT